MEKAIEDFLSGKSQVTRKLFEDFVTTYSKLGEVTVHPAKTMIGIANSHKRIAWIIRLGKNFVHIVFPFRKAYPDNLCFIKIAQVPGDYQQFNHHFRIYSKEDVNDEVMHFMKLAYLDEAAIQQ